jgi:1-acyl-sn-glycerol-3-phosphate acyltransferase
MPGEQDLPRVAPWTLRFFRRIVRSYFRRHFRAVLVQGSERLAGIEGPLIVYGNHASWWDPMISVLLAQMLLPGRKHYAPMDAEPLKRYPILRRIGIFPVELNSARGAAQFLRTARAVLASGGVLWLTPQGRFADVRERPLRFKPGLAALALRVPGVQLLPLAVEYPFWSERLPETLVHIAKPLQLAPDLSTEAATEQLEAALEAAMANLQQAAMQRDPLVFETLLEGRRGTGGFYALGRRFRALFAGRRFEEDHSARDRRVREARR